MICLQPGLGWKFLLRREPGRGRECSRCNLQDVHSLTKRNLVSLVRIHFSHSESDGKSADVGGGGRIGILIKVDTEHDRAKVPPYNGNDPPPAPGSLKALLFPPLLNNVQNKGTQGVRARYGVELPPFISIVRYPGRPVIFPEDQ